MCVTTVRWNVRLRSVSQYERNAALPNNRPLRLSGQKRLPAKCASDSDCGCGCVCRYCCCCCRCGCYCGCECECCCAELNWLNCTCRRWATAAGECCVSTECQLDGDLPNENCCVQANAAEAAADAAVAAVAATATAGEGEGGPQR